MELKITRTCPLGHKCEVAVDQSIQRCAWFIKIEGTHPQSGQLIDSWDCAIAWQPVLMIEQSAQIRTVACSVQAAGNRSEEQQKAALKLLESSTIGIEHE